MVFQIPPNAPTHYDRKVKGRKTGESIAYSPLTLKKYKSKLNWLANQGYDTPELLMTKAYDIVPLIAEHSKTLKGLHQRRIIISAVMWVVPEYYSRTPNPYYRLFQESFHNLATDYISGEE